MSQTTESHLVLVKWGKYNPGWTMTHGIIHSQCVEELGPARYSRVCRAAVVCLFVFCMATSIFHRGGILAHFSLWYFFGLLGCACTHLLRSHFNNNEARTLIRSLWHLDSLLFFSHSVVDLQVCLGSFPCHHVPDLISTELTPSHYCPLKNAMWPRKKHTHRLQLIINWTQNLTTPTLIILKFVTKDWCTLNVYALMTTTFQQAFR